jgi:plasmid maintenance system antidote protein VapI
MRNSLRQFLADRHMTQSDLAGQLGMARGSLNRVLNGAQAITPEFIGKFYLAHGPQVTAQVFGPTHQPAEAVA